MIFPQNNRVVHHFLLFALLYVELEDPIRGGPTTLAYFFLQLKELLTGVTVNCNSPLQVKLDGPQEYMWTFEVRIQVTFCLDIKRII